MLINEPIDLIIFMVLIFVLGCFITTLVCSIYLLIDYLYWCRSIHRGDKHD